MEEMDKGVKELVDFDELVKNINKATKSDPLTNSILRKLDGANVPKGWELTLHSGQGKPLVAGCPQPPQPPNHQTFWRSKDTRVGL